MKAAVLYGKKNIKIEELNLPSSEDNFIVKVDACGICISDVKGYQHGKSHYYKPPVILGHESVGNIFTVPKGINKFKKGDRVAVVHAVNCGYCNYCQRGLFELCENKQRPSNGGFAEYISIGKEFANQALNNYFLVPREKIPDHLDIMVLLEKSTVPPRNSNDLASLKDLLNDAIDAWTGLMADAIQGKSVLENIIHGLRLQALKVEVYQKVDTVLGLLDNYGDEKADLPSLGGIKDLINVLDDFLKGFELIKYKTKELYEKLIYDEEVKIELGIRFDRPAQFLNNLKDGLKTILKQVKNTIECAKGTSEFGSLAIEITGFTSKIIDYSEGKGNYPFMDEMEGMVDFLDNYAKKSDKEIQVKIIALKESVDKLHGYLDEFIFKLAMERMEPSFLRRF